MITPYFGEFLLVPIPLELSLNVCSHRCSYCFANLNKPDRKAAPQSIVNLLAEIDDRDTIEARLLRARYPVLISNKVDPFSESNWRLTLQILELLAALKIPVAFQTKGGRGLKEALDLIGPSCFYFSITFHQDAAARVVEPGAPSITERLKMMELVTSRGHHAWAGVNPLVCEWIPQPKPFVKMLADHGVRHVWSEVLHLSRDQVANMSNMQRAALGEGVIRDALAKKITEETYNHEMDLIEACREYGVDFACKHWPAASKVLEPYAARYPKLFPTMTDFTNWAWATKKPGDEITYDEFSAVLRPQLPDYELNALNHYIFSCNRASYNDSYQGKVWSHDDLLRYVWIERGHRMNPRRSRAFKWVELGKKNNVVQLKRDAAGLPVIYFTGRTLERR